MITKCLKVFKKSSSETPATVVVPPVVRPQTFNERGLVHQRLSDAVTHYTQQSQAADQEMTSPESVGSSFNDGLRRSLVPAMNAQQANNTALFGNRLGLDGCSPNYHNIFGSINSYDQAIT